jgi:hypothetical protein
VSLRAGRPKQSETDNRAYLEARTFEKDQIAASDAQRNPCK